MVYVGTKFVIVALLQCMCKAFKGSYSEEQLLIAVSAIQAIQEAGGACKVESASGLVIKAGITSTARVGHKTFTSDQEQQLVENVLRPTTLFLVSHP
jgi:hypothetical protein